MKNLKLRAARKKAKLTQAQVAKLAGVSESIYQRYEYGVMKPSVDTAIRIADALDILDLREIFPRKEDS